MPTHDPAAALALLETSARAARSDPERTETAVLEALRLAPEDPDVCLGAYRFYFYNHRFEEALPHCEALMGQAARRLNIATDWRAVAPGDADFGAAEFAPGLYLQVLIAWAYCQLRRGHLPAASEALEHCLRLDPGDRFGAGAILGHVHDREAADDTA